MDSEAGLPGSAHSAAVDQHCLLGEVIEYLWASVFTLGDYKDWTN